MKVEGTFREERITEETPTLISSISTMALRAELDVLRDMHVVFTKWVFVEVCDIHTLI